MKEKSDTWMTGLSLSRWNINSKFLPGTIQSFLDQLAFRDEGNTASPVAKEEHPANTASSAHALEDSAPEEECETRRAGHGIVSDGSQTWESKQWRDWCAAALLCERSFSLH